MVRRARYWAGHRKNLPLLLNVIMLSITIEIPGTKFMVNLKDTFKAHLQKRNKMTLLYNMSTYHNDNNLFIDITTEKYQSTHHKNKFHNKALINVCKCCNLT